MDEASEWIYRVLRHHIKMMHYSGDTDGVVPTWGTKQWIQGLGWEVKTPWAQWKATNSYAGN